jgi:NADH-quinone oxidoreductase subunit M
MIGLSLVAVLYVGLVAMVQKDMKKLVAYSSVAHMGFVTLGFFIFNDLGVSGGMVQMIAHGFVSVPCSCPLVCLYDRVHSREIASYGGVVNTMPKFTAFALFFLSWPTAVYPEQPVLLVNGWLFWVPSSSISGSAWLGCQCADFWCSLHLVDVQTCVLGPVGNDHVKNLTDINGT